MFTAPVTPLTSKLNALLVGFGDAVTVKRVDSAASSVAILSLFFVTDVTQLPSIPPLFKCAGTALALTQLISPFPGLHTATLSILFPQRTSTTLMVLLY